MKDVPDADWWRYFGMLFQLPMLVCAYARITLFQKISLFPITPPNMLIWIALTVFMYTVIRIYFAGFVWSRWTDAEPHLIKRDVFRLTRHPMYHAIFFLDSTLFFQAGTERVLFWITWALFFSFLLAAGWCQEKKTLARWGNEAAAYYQRTPRFIVEWLRRKYCRFGA